MTCKHLQILSKLILALVAYCSQSVVAQETPSNAPKAIGKVAIDAKHVRSFLETHCVRCHNAKEQEGKVALDQFPQVQ